MSPQKTPPAQPESLDYPFAFGGKNFVLRFGYRAGSRLKDHWGFHTDPPGTEPRLTGDQKLAQRLEYMEVEDIPVMLWACLRSNHPDLTLEDVEEMVDKFGINPIQPILAKVMTAAMPPAEAGEKKSPTATKR